MVYSSQNSVRCSVQKFLFCSIHLLPLKKKSAIHRSFSGPFSGMYLASNSILLSMQARWGYVYARLMDWMRMNKLKLSLDKKNTSFVDIPLAQDRQSGSSMMREIRSLKGLLLILKFLSFHIYCMCICKIPLLTCAP